MKAGCGATKCYSSLGAVWLAAVGWSAAALAAELPFPPELTRPAPLTMAELATRTTEGVSVVEVSDYIFGKYQGKLPSPPCADLNPKKAFVISWKNFPFRFVFSHEGSYCPWFELPDGAGVSYQFFEGNEGWAELFNEWGRQERNSFVDILESGPKRVWVRWTYCGVNIAAGQPAYRATEDFWGYPNGLLLRRQTYRTLLPGKHTGYTREPIEVIGLCPVGKLWSDVLRKDSASEERHALAVLDAFSPKRYDVYWTPKTNPAAVYDSTHRRAGCAWKELEDTPGVALVVPMKEGSPFCIFGDTSGFRHDYTRLKEHTFEGNGKGGEIWGSSQWDHWPIGWLNSQGHNVTKETLPLYPGHFSPIGMDFFALPNEVEEQGIYYSLYGVGGSDLEGVRTLARQWLEQESAAIIQPSSIEHLTLQPGQEAKPAAAGPGIKSFSNGLINLTIQEAQRNGRSEFWVHQVQRKLPDGWQTILEGVDGGEFSTSLGGANATVCEVVKDDANRLTVRMSGKQDGWEAAEVLELAAGSQVLQRKQTYRLRKAFEGAIHPGFRLKAQSALRYTFPVKADERPLAELKQPIRAAVDHGLPLPFHIWHNRQYVALYGLDKSVSPGTIDFGPVEADGRAALRVYYPDSSPEEARAKFIPILAEATPKTTKLAEGTELTLTEIIAARPLVAGEEPLLEADRIAASILLRRPGRPVDLKAAADGIAGFFKHCGLWEPNALGPGRGWFRNMWTRTCTGSGADLKFNGVGRKEGAEEFNGHYDLTWGEGYAVYTWLGILRHWKRTGDTDLLKYLDEMTKSMDSFKRGTGPDEPYYDRRHRHNGQFADYTGRKVIWTHLLGMIGSQTIKLYQAAPDYPNPATRNQWLTVATRIGNFLAKHQQVNGDLQDTFDENNRETLRDAHRCSARAVVCGLWTRLGQVTGDKAWTERAVRLGKAVAPEVRRYEFVNAHVDHPACPDGEAPFYVLAGLVPLYEATGDPEMLAACKAAAAYGISWTYFYDVPTPKTHNGVARGGQCCCRCTPIIYVIGPGIAVEPLLALSRLTGDSFYRQMAAETASYIGHSQIDAPGKPWHGGVIHAFLMYCGQSHGPEREGQVDTGMATGSSLAALEAWLAHLTQSDAKP